MHSVWHTGAHPMRILLLYALCVPLAAQAPELRTTAADRTALSITIYQNDLAVIRDTRRATLPAGGSRLAFADVAATIRPKSAFLLDPGQGVKVVERDFEFNLLSPENLELASLGGTVALRNPATGARTWGTQVSVPWPRGLRNPKASAFAKMARLPSVYLVRPTSQILIQTPDGYEASGISAPIYHKVPNALRPSPTLRQTLNADTAGPRDLCLLYTATGLSWQAHYIATLDADAHHLDLAAFATVDNKSGINYPDATFQLVAGDPNIVPDPDPIDGRDEPMIDAANVSATVVVVASAAPEFREEGLSEYPLFTLDQRVSLKNGQQKQLALFHVEHIPFQVKAILETTSKNGEPMKENDYLDPLGRWLSFDSDEPPAGRIQFNFFLQKPTIEYRGRLRNTASNHLGRSLPSGTMSIRYRSPEGVLLDLGSPEIEGTPAGEEIELPLPTAHGLSATRAFRSLKVVRKQGMSAIELDVEVRLSNTSRRTIPVTIREPFFQDWTMVRSNLPGHRSGGDAYDFEGRAQPGSTLSLHYRIRTAYQPL